MMLQASLKGELEANQQQLESSKVTQAATCLPAIAFSKISRFESQHIGHKVSFCAFRSMFAS